MSNNQVVNVKTTFHEQESPVPPNPAGDERIKIESYNTLNETTPLHYAIDTANLAVIRMLIIAGSKLDLIDSDGEAAAHYAIRESRTDALRLLLQSGANPNLANDDGESLLHFAASLGEENCCRLLVQAGANISCLDESGCTPLAEAKNNGHSQVVQFLRSCSQPQQQQQQQKDNACPYSSFQDIRYGNYTVSPVSISNKSCF
ncbi:ankyrin repeat-containing protein [Heterostelium album PN500]|uniref:Ankyrin repeat-containing protein n=1 Tax=Heterostelium pallidum (strain ATCC 26659 / Pp 5 / PN500) TaxID=670386 RepID=D3BEH5_HETP5|nr:ankyrin repeat-containing protein [Heterostelium album PN500]EFA80306.1 ankyrin repeat-containing protein [Heterostelium album PN500]|eukprot:XP_020432426.1 ankyrin repeat-containing protein [Heterostelium album PN500]